MWGVLKQQVFRHQGVFCMKDPPLKGSVSNLGVPL